MNQKMCTEEMLKAFIQLRGYVRISEAPHIVYHPARDIKIQIFICQQDKLDMNYFYKSYEQLAQPDEATSSSTPHVSHLIFIYNIATIQIKKLKMYKDILKIEFFNENELRRLLTGHRLIPRHIQVDQPTRAEIIQKFGRDNLPMILHTDPIVKLYDFDLDAVLQIERPDGLYYRLVVADE
jgi:DNA-directed RNA polymerase subunit H (RpoH/RPB5)